MDCIGLGVVRCSSLSTVCHGLGGVRCGLSWFGLCKGQFVLAWVELGVVHLAQLVLFGWSKV